ncbi:MAG: RagB/SusD family nutrient uptake outer membrane protein [Bacteroidales bacterium]
MKYIIFTLLTLVILFSSCEKMLEEQTYGAATEESMLKDEKNIILLVGQAYADMRWLHDHWGYWGINTLTADESLCPIRNPGAHWNDGGYWRSINNHRWTVEDDAFENVWNLSISGAVLCNKILQTLHNNKEVIDPALYAQYVGELEVLRSYYFYTLFDCFGRIPYTENFEESESVPLLEVAETWKQLVACLERNAPNLPIITDGNRSQNYGRATQGLAYALLARLYLNAESYGVQSANAYNRCIEVCDEIIQSGSYSIESDFFSNFKIKNENSKENIFVIVEDGSHTFDVQYNGYMMNKWRVAMLTLHPSHQKAWGLLESPWNGFCAPQEFIDKYDPMDLRGTGEGYETNGTKNTGTYGWFVGGVYDPKTGALLEDENKNPSIVTKSLNSVENAAWGDGARFIKYEVDKTSTYLYVENDFVLFRYADVLYMQYEASLRAGTGHAAALLANVEFQRIRTRAGLAPYSSLDIDELLNERGREFAWENVRRRDLIRFGHFQNGSWAGWGSWRNVHTSEHLKWFPIPGPILRKATSWSQNSGY